VANELLELARVFAHLESRPGAERIVQAVRGPLAPDDLSWAAVFDHFGPDHPQWEFVLAELSDPLPAGFIGMALLDTTFHFARHEGLTRNPFDTPAGRARLAAWLDPAGRESFAVSAAASLTFINEGRQELLTLARRHPSSLVRLQAAWASARRGDDRGFEELQVLCLDLNRSAVACEYLRELGREDLTPKAVQSQAFQTRCQLAAEVASALRGPVEPLELDVLDQRELSMTLPVSVLTQAVSLVWYRLPATGDGADAPADGEKLTGILILPPDSHGVGGSGGADLRGRPPEDAYALHIAHRLKAEGFSEIEVEKPEQFAGLLDGWKGAALTGAKVVRLARLDPAIGYPQQIVALATAVVAGEPGFAILDGPRSDWYPEADFPQGTTGSMVLQIHIGRVLLRFGQAADRRRFVHVP
jgi:hypothetical protein